MSVSEDSLESLKPAELVKAAKEAIKFLEKNPPIPWADELLKNFLRDFHRYRKEETTTSSSEVSSDKNQLRIGKKLVVSLSKDIGEGTNGTVVYKGTYEGRPVAVKRIQESHFKLAYNETEKLIASDHGQNIVRYHGKECDEDFIYLALELCDCNLNDLIQTYSREFSDQPVSNDIHYTDVKNIFGSVELWKKEPSRPSPLLLKLMRDMVSGLVHLHKCNPCLIHRDLKPQNVLISKGSSTLCAKLSDMGTTRFLSGQNDCLSDHSSDCTDKCWKAPEQLHPRNKHRLTSAMDLFSLGCVLFFCISRGVHPFGRDNVEQETNIVENNMTNQLLTDDFPEASDLISRLLQARPEDRPTAIEVLLHPFFWDAEKRLSFLHDTSDRVINKKDLVTAIDSTACAAFGTTSKGKVLTWDKKVDDRIINHTRSYLTRDYKFGSVRDLLRLIRNMFNHYKQLPKDIQILIGPQYERFDDYFTSRFPMLMIEVYKVVRTYCGQEGCFRKYFKGNM